MFFNKGMSSVYHLISSKYSFLKWNAGVTANIEESCQNFFSKIYSLMVSVGTSGQI